MGYGFFVFAAPKFVFLYFVTTQHNMNGSPFTWFVGMDVARCLGYINHRKALRDHVDEEDRKDGVTIRDSIGRDQEATFINESGLTHRGRLGTGVLKDITLTITKKNTLSARIACFIFIP